MNKNMEELTREELEAEVRNAQRKSQALLERVSEIVVEYENKVADLRVALTAFADENGALREAIETVAAPADSTE